MIPAAYGITIYRGGTFDIRFTGSDKNGPIIFDQVYTAAELNIYEAWWDDNDTEPPAIFEMSTDNGMITIIGGSINLHIPAGVTQGITFNSGVYRLKLIVEGAVPIIDFFMIGSVTVKLPM